MASNGVIGWSIVYDDFSIYHSDYSPEDMPIDGVQYIVEYLENNGRRYVHGMDYYRWTGDSWCGGNIGDLRGWLRKRKEIPIILYGRWISDSEYQKAREIATRLRYDDRIRTN